MLEILSLSSRPRDMWVALVSAILLIIFLWKWKANGSAVLPKGPAGWPVIGNLLQIKPGKFHCTLDDWSKEFGPIFNCNLLGTNTVVLSSPELIRKAFSTDKYGKIFNDRPDSFIGKYCQNNYSGIITSRYNDTLFKLRRTFHTALHLYGDGVPRFEHAVKTEIADLIVKIKLFEGKDFDPVPVFERSLGNLVSILLCGKPMSENDVKIVWDFIKITSGGASALSERVLFRLPFLRFFPGKFRHVYLAVLKVESKLWIDT